MFQGVVSQLLLMKHFSLSLVTNFTILLKTSSYSEIKGLKNFDKVIQINQSPIGRTSRSNPATYTGVYNDIREIYSKLPESTLRGYKPGRFSFNVKGGRCEECFGRWT